MVRRRYSKVLIKELTYNELLFENLFIEYLKHQPIDFLTKLDRDNFSMQRLVKIAFGDDYETIVFFNSLI